MKRLVTILILFFGTTSLMACKEQDNGSNNPGSTLSLCSGDTKVGDQQSRIHYRYDVAADCTKIAETQTRTCSEQGWGDWSGTYVFATCEDNDSDDDSINNSNDNCPDVANADQKDSDSDGAGDLCDEDDDNDSIADGDDNCSLIANSDQADDDKDSIGNKCDRAPFLAKTIDLAEGSTFYHANEGNRAVSMRVYDSKTQSNLVIDLMTPEPLKAPLYKLDPSADLIPGVTANKIGWCNHGNFVYLTSEKKLMAWIAGSSSHSSYQIAENVEDFRYIRNRGEAQWLNGNCQGYYLIKKPNTTTQPTSYTVSLIAVISNSYSPTSDNPFHIDKELTIDGMRNLTSVTQAFSTSWYGEEKVFFQQNNATDPSKSRIIWYDRKKDSLQSRTISKAREISSIDESILLFGPGWNNSMMDGNSFLSLSLFKDGENLLDLGKFSLDSTGDRSYEHLFLNPSDKGVRYVAVQGQNLVVSDITSDLKETNLFVEKDVVPLGHKVTGIDTVRFYKIHELTGDYISSTLLLIRSEDVPTDPSVKKQQHLKYLELP